MPTYEQAKRQWEWETSGRGNVHVSQADSGPAIFLLVCVAMIPLLIVGAGVLFSDASLPLTEHAKTSHAGQTWNASSISAYFRDCKEPVYTYSCGNGIKVKYCEIKPGLSIGLLIGETVEQIVSGYAGSTKYWCGRGGK
jgi:hypothetical protein